jgi:hypothetical protein
MAKAFRGLYRTVAWAYVTNGTMAFQVPEADYHAFGNEPDYDNLPWRENYNAAKGREKQGILSISSNSAMRSRLADGIVSVCYFERARCLVLSLGGGNETALQSRQRTK